MNLFGVDLTALMMGNTLGQYTGLFVGFLLSIVFAKVVYYTFKNIFRKWAEKTETDLDDILVEILEHPTTMFVIVLGFYLSTILTLTPGTAPHSFLITTVKIMAIIDVAWFLLRLIDTLIVFYVKPLVEKSHTDLDDQLLPIFRKGIKLTIIVLTFLFVLSNFGYDISTLLAGLGVGGLAVALAAQDTVSNFIGSVIIFSDKPFKIRDFVKFGGFMGTVKEIGIRSTKLETPQGTILVVPNSKISTEIVENFSRASKRRIEINIGLTYDTGYKKLQKAISLLEKIGEDHPNVVDQDVKFVEFGAFSLNINARYWVKPASKFREVQHQLSLTIKKEFDKAKLDMAFPTQTLYIKKD